MDRIVVVGASLAGLRAATTLRDDGYEGSLTIVGDEQHRPYDRPPLSKQVLAGEWGPDHLHLAHEDVDAEWVLGDAATSLDLERHVVTTTSGAELPYDGLVVATGASVRRLPGQPEVEGVHVLRTVDDAVALRAQVEAGIERVVVVGAGFIGSEVAATCREAGTEVTVLEMAPVPLERALGAEMGAVMGRLHVQHGVDLRLETGVAAIEGEGRVERLVLSDGSTLEADCVVVGIGVSPNTGWLDGSGLTVDDGVVCDETCLAAPGVVAAGDVARWQHPRWGSLRVEHWENAQEQAEHAARTLLAHGRGEAGSPYAPIPWFWSDQYDRKIQVAGHPEPGDEVRVVDGSTDEHRFVALYGDGERLNAVLGVNRPRLVVQYRMRMVEGLGWDEALALEL
jgi:3-phenylpropionate/trans-cinnamate dioxygenase ferredoxin reductase subunit